jgi:hypothetical protein
MADLEKQIDAVLGGKTATRSSREPKPARDSGKREGVLIGVGLAALLGFGLWQVWSADKPPHKGA